MGSHIETAGLWPFRYAAAIFDFDGTLADTSDVWNEVDVEFFSERQLPWSAEIANHFASLGFSDAAQWVVDEFGLDETAESVRAQWMEAAVAQYRTSVDLQPGAAEYLRALGQAGVPATLATTNSRVVIDALKTRIPLDEFFSHIICGEDVKRSKNFPDIYLEAARRMSVEPEDCLVFEDIPQAIRSAHAAGMTVVGVLSGDPNQAIEEVCAEADFILEDWRDIAIN